MLTKVKFLVLAHAARLLGGRTMFYVRLNNIRTDLVLGMYEDKYKKLVENIKNQFK